MILGGNVYELIKSLYSKSSCSVKTDPFTLPNGTKFNSLLYADDLVIISKSKYGLNNCLKTLETFK